MITCPNCRHNNRHGILFCEDCGYSLTDLVAGNATIPTRRVQNDPDESSSQGTWGAANFKTGSEIIVHIRGVGTPMTFTPDKKLIFGRSDSNSTAKPDIDLSVYEAVEKGVSRQHATLEVSEDTLMLMDLGSSNGTYINGQRLVPNQPRVLRDGDEVRLGKLVVHIYFK